MTVIRVLCVYCGSSDDVDPAHLDLARRLGRKAAERGIAIVYGGGRVGLMGALGHGAKRAGGQVIGIIPRFLEDREVGDRDVDEYHIVESMHERKSLMFDKADAFCILPGGLGTLDETFEIITWRLLALHDKPVVMINPAGYWDPLLALIDHQIAAGYLRRPVSEFLYVVPDVASAFEALASAPPPQIEPASERL